MEASKLHNVILDAINENTDFALDQEITNLISQIQANQSEQITTTLNEIEKRLAQSVFNHYSISNYKILQTIDGESYFGETANFEIRHILNQNSFNISKTISELQEFQKKRKEFISTITKLEEAFTNLGIDTHFYDDDTYEIGILFPSKENNNKIGNIAKELSKWDAVCKSIQELVGSEVEDTKITLVSNGSLEFFSTHTVHIAICISYILDRLCTVYKKVLEIREAREKLKELGAPKAEEDVVKKYEKDFLTKELDSIANEIIKQYASKKIEDGRLNEIKIAIKGHLTYVAKAIDKGLVIEITPPEIQEPEILKQEETEDNKKERKHVEKEYSEKLAKIEVIKKSLDLSKLITSAGRDVFKALTSGENEEEEGKEDSKK